MSTIRIRNNNGTNINVAHNGDITIQGRFTYLATASESVTEDAPTNSISAGAIAGGRDGEQPPIKPLKARKGTAMIGSMIRRKVKDEDN